MSNPTRFTLPCIVLLISDGSILPMIDPIRRPLFSFATTFGEALFLVETPAIRWGHASSSFFFEPPEMVKGRGGPIPLFLDLFASGVTVG